ncbi:DNA sulfur modification protein DndB [Alteromonas macleodii]|uniref:DGQHR domain protein n=1 Tax=Alteromonas macleodii TaxID=28108 RepID=A0AB36FNG8_ALTMA|nr:DNA sulfur modification protein DndB [Alteromonas macleodii]OES24245.1 DGQHR domain protein [Alteromonas macleodii]OES24876.1 DGQHR domain protein [Alteromonas macleodii]OES25154.1 DGQHR domain protein [Alteromonas macleodii]OES39195.1 DGQHR domain protein [Alteromonas macleodii]
MQIIWGIKIHRQGGIEEALKRRPQLKDNMCTVVLFYDQGLERSQQIFADINTNGVKPSKALSILFDRKNRFNALVIDAIKMANIHDAIDYERAAPAKSSPKVWGVTAVKKAAEVVLGINERSIVEYEENDIDVLTKLFANWLMYIVDHIPGDLAKIVHSQEAELTIAARENCINTHAAFLYVLAHASRIAISDFHEQRLHYLDERGNLALYLARKGIKTIELSSSFPDVPVLDALGEIASLPVSKTDQSWMGRIVNPDGTMNPNVNNVKLGAWFACQHLGLSASDEMTQLNNQVFGELLQ